MLQLDRQKQILDYLKKNRKATTNELSELLGVSTTTIRTDLNQMDKDCLLKKTHGGAVSRDNVPHDSRRIPSDSRSYTQYLLHNTLRRKDNHHLPVRLRIHVGSSRNDIAVHVPLH